MLMESASWTPAQKELYTELVRAFLSRHSRGRRILAIDGPDGAGKTRFGDSLQVAFARANVEAFRASVDDFHHPREFRYRQGPNSPRGYYQDAFDYHQLQRVLLEPFRLGGSTSFVTKAFDVQTDQPIAMKWESAGPDAVLIVDGVFLQRPVLKNEWNAVLWLEASEAERGRRMQARDGAHPLLTHPSHGRYQGAHAHYREAVKPEEHATFLVDNTDWRAPRQYFPKFEF
ncbi:uridine kinase [Humidisolicoccus flavus]|uniref:uridine kinase n=1 Tax=Humidisolicoccus flavus TaxID=3111414 RepID=UPI003255550C